MTKYKAIDEFRINFSNDSVTVKKGTIFSFDGINVEVMGWDGVVKTGTAPVLQKQIGSWLVPVAEAKAEAPARPAVRTASAIEPGETVEKDGAKIIRQEDDGLAAMIDNYEKKSNLQEKKGPTVINEDASIVKQVRRVAGENTIKNTSGVQLEDSEVGRKTVVSREQQVAKTTTYNPTLDASEPKKQHREILSDGDGVVVKKTKTAAIFRTEMNENVRVRETDTGDTIVEGAVAKETTYDEASHVDITGTSTQAQTLSNKAAPKANSNPKKAAEEKAKRMKQVGLDQQEGVVVGKVRKDEDPKTSAEGFVAKLSVGKNEEKSGEVEFGGNLNGIEGGEATVGSGGVSPVDASDEGVDITDILDKL